jgi:methyl-accepting chemotaxis protein
MGSSGKTFGVQLSNQKLLTNTKRADLNMFLQEYVDFDDLQEYVAWKSLENYWVNLPDNRMQSWNLAIPASTSLGFYTKHNGEIVNILREVARRASDGSIESRLLAYLGFMFMKEKAGNERAVGTLGFSNNMWPDVTSWQKFISLVAIQNNAYLYFEQFGSTESKDLWFSLQDSLANQILNPWQAGALANDSAVMIPVDSADWFNNMTAKINEWRLVEKMVANELTSFFDALEEETNNFLYGISIMVGVLFLFTIHIGVKGIRLLLRSNAYNLYQDKLKEEKLRAKAKAKAKAKKEAKRKKKAEKAKALKSAKK